MKVGTRPAFNEVAETEPVPSVYPYWVTLIVAVDEVSGATPVTVTRPVPLTATVPDAVAVPDHVKAASKFVICTVKPSAVGVGMPNSASRAGASGVTAFDAADASEVPPALSETAVNV